jgi:probable addiction module antidote protein
MRGSPAWPTKKQRRATMKRKKKKTTYKPFDPAAYLDNDAVIAEYLSAAAEDPNPEVFVTALGDVAKARGMAQIAKDTGLGRESLYKSLSAGAHPRFETINSVLHALGVKFAVVAEREGPRRAASSFLRTVCAVRESCCSCALSSLRTHPAFSCRSPHVPPGFATSLV